MQASHLQENRNIEELVDERLGSQVNKEEVERTVKVALLCTNATPSVRPTMSEAVQMIEGNMPIPNTASEGSDVRFRAMKDFQQGRPSQTSSSGSQIQNSTAIPRDATFSSYASEFYESSSDI